MSQPLLKNAINSSSIKHLSSLLQEVYPDFPATLFKQHALKNLQKLELKDRIHHIIAALNQALPANFKQTATLLTTLKNLWRKNSKDDPYSFTAWAVIDYVGVHGIHQPKIALPLLQHLTSLFSAEFAIRPFIEQHPKLTWTHLHKWAKHNDEHVRRLASEGCRPRLPWGSRLHTLIKDPTPIIAVLDKLKDDSSEYVRRSVANNLNDIAKDHPDLVIKICKRWQKNRTEQRDWIIRHATRSLVKNGHPDVFSLLGYTEKPSITLSALTLASNKITLGQALEFSCTIKSDAATAQKFVVDYAIYYVKANGSTSAKVYKLKNVALDAKQTLPIKKTKTFVPISTRTFYAGRHYLELLINGVVFEKQHFELLL